MSKPRHNELHRRQRRKRKLAHLRAQYQAAKSKETQDKILQKLRRVAPTVTPEQFIKA
jgi:hypothetical protein